MASKSTRRPAEIKLSPKFTTFTQSMEWNQSAVTSELIGSLLFRVEGLIRDVKWLLEAPAERLADFQDRWAEDALDAEVAEFIAEFRRQQKGRDRANKTKFSERACEHCGRPIFFALRGDNRWIPFEVEKIRANEVHSSLRYVIQVDSNGVPHVSVDKGTDRYLVWVNHMKTCGAAPPPIDDKMPLDALIRRWKVNVEYANVRTSFMAEGLLTLRRELLASQKGPDGETFPPG